MAGEHGTLVMSPWCSVTQEGGTGGQHCARQHRGVVRVCLPAYARKPHSTAAAWSFVLRRRSRASSEPWHPSTNDWNVQIEKDLHRTFPGHPLMNRRGRGTLRRILAAYSRRNDAVGYCQVGAWHSAAVSQMCASQGAAEAEAETCARDM